MMKLKKLKKILLINWLYFSKQLIEVGDINFITGKNGAGKSTIIDALQIVLLGEISTNNFNKAASGASHRTVDGYLRGDIDAANPKSRRGKDFASYIACEFYDDVERVSFVAGINFDCRSDGTAVDHYFLYDGIIPEDCYIQDQSAMEISKFRAWLKSGAVKNPKVYDRRGEYRADLLSRWNVHNEQVCQMLKRAVSFKPIVDIQKFITENICDTMERPDIELMQQNIRDYKRQELLATKVEKKVAALQGICSTFVQAKEVQEELARKSFVVAWAGREIIQEEIHQQQEKIQIAEEDIEVEKVGLQSIKTDYAKLDEEKVRLHEELAQDPNKKQQALLEGSKQALEAEGVQLKAKLQRLLLEMRQEAQLLTSFARKLVDYEALQESNELQEATETLLRHYQPLLNVQLNCLEEPVDYFRQLQEVTAGFASLVQEELYQWREQQKQLQEEEKAKAKILQDLQKNIKDYPTEILQLRDYLRLQLQQEVGHQVQVDILADVLEIANGCEAWRGVVEGYLNKQKFYLLVDPDYYEQAVELFDAVKKNYRNSWGLVDIGKLRKHEKLQLVQEALAHKVETENHLARTYIDYLLGRVVCCEQVADLRKYPTAVTVEGMLYKGYVARPLLRRDMEDSFIGQRAVELRRQSMGEQLAGLQAELSKINGVCQLLQSWKPANIRFNERFVNTEITERKVDYRRGLELEQELAQVLEQLSRLDLFYSEQLEKQLQAVSKRLLEAEEEKERVTKRIAKLENTVTFLKQDKLPGLFARAAEKQAQLNQQFTEEYQNTLGLGAYQEVLAELQRPQIIERKLAGSLGSLKKKKEALALSLEEARRSYQQSFPPCTFNIHSEDNHEYAAELQLLEDNQLPLYREKIARSRMSALAQFQSDFLAKLKYGIDKVQNQVKNLNRALRQGQFGADKYQFKVEKNPDYADYYEMIMSQELLEGTEGLFSDNFHQKYGKLVEELFRRIVAADDEQVNARQQSELQQNIERYTDFRTYLKFDLETTSKNGTKQLLSKTLNKKSGGETQTPFYIAVLAAFAQLYQVDNPSVMANNTVRLVLFDEAFNKMDSERIVESVKLLRKLGLQAIICTPPDKMPDIAPLADYSIPVVNEGFRMQVIPYSKEVLQQWQQEE